MTWFRAGGGGIPASLKNGMNAVLNKKFGTSGQTYAPSDWPDDVNLLGKLPEKTVSGSIANITDAADDVPIADGEFSFVPSGGGGTLTAPIPVVGYTGMNIYQTGKNLLSCGSSDEQTLNQVSFTADGKGRYTVSGTATGGSATFYVDLSKPYTIRTGDYLHIMNSAAVANCSLGLRTANSGIVAPAMSPANRIFSLASYVGQTVERLSIYVANGGTFEGTITPMIINNNTATTFEEYKAKTPIVDNFGRTIYGGTRKIDGTLLDGYLRFTANDVTGLYWNNRKEQQVDTYHRATFRIATTSGLLKTTDSLSNGLSYNANITGGTGSIVGYQIASAGIYFCIDLSTIGLGDATSSTDNSVFLDAIHSYGDNIEFVCNVSSGNETEYTLEALKINTYLGANNIYTDIGESKITYRADIDLALAQLSGTRGLMMASRSISPMSGEEASLDRENILEEVSENSDNEESEEER